MTAIKPYGHDDAENVKNCAARLRRYFPIGSHVAITIMHVSKGNMRRVVKVLGFDKDRGRIVDVSYEVAVVTGDKIDPDRGGVVVDGVGMDMGHALVYELSTELYRNSRSKKIEKGQAGYALRAEYV